MAVLEGKLHMQKGNFVAKTLTFNKGAMTIKNVPHLVRNDQNVIDYYLPGSVSLRISAIAEYMEDFNLSTFDYNDLNKFPEIQNDYL